MTRRVAGAVSAVSHVSSGAGGHATLVRFEAEHVEVSSGSGDGGRGFGQQIRMMVMMVMVVVRMVVWPDARLQGSALHDHIGFGLLSVLLVLWVLQLLLLLLLLRSTYGTSVTQIAVISSVVVIVIVIICGTIVVGVFGRAVFRINYWARLRRRRLWRFDQLDVVERVPIVRGRRPRAGGQGHADHAPGQCQAYADGRAYDDENNDASPGRRRRGIKYCFKNGHAVYY